MNICPQCDVTFARRDQVFCSRQCYGRAQRGRQRFSLMPEYFEQRSIPEPNSGCWIWLRTLAKDGYGGFRLTGHPYMSAHRGSYIAHKGTVPSGLTVDHLCRLRCCVNPDHLEAVTHAENMRRRSISQTHCIHGHPLDGKAAKRRFCKQCAKDATAKYQRRLKVQKGPEHE